ncbi:MAG: biotin/lipoate A/B protein ligase family protein [Chloroflexota bacterium]
MNKDTWRLIISEPASGAYNMAVDEAILESVVSQSSPPTMRFYSWSPPCLSLGYSQSSDIVDWESCSARGWVVVRRPTGGGAILHTDELTYSICVGQDEPRMAGTIIESYRRIAVGLVDGLQRLGLRDAESSALDEPYSASGPVCFDEPSHYEITYKGRKLVGSAQSRRLGGILQHGSIPLSGDITRILYALRNPGAADAERLRNRAVTLTDALGSEIDPSRIIEVLANSIAQSIEVELLVQELSTDEVERVDELIREKYGNGDWTLAR